MINLERQNSENDFLEDFSTKLKGAFLLSETNFNNSDLSKYKDNKDQIYDRLVELFKEGLEFGIKPEELYEKGSDDFKSKGNVEFYFKAYQEALTDFEASKIENND